MHRRHDRLVGSALLDLFVKAFLDKDPFQRAEVQFVLELLLLQLEFAFEDVHELRGVFSQHFRDGHFHRPIVLDDDDAAGRGDLAVGKRVEGID